VDASQTILYNNPNTPQFYQIYGKIIEIELFDLKNDIFGEFYFMGIYFSSGKWIYNSIIGGVNDQNIYIFKRIEQQHIKFKTLISEILSIYNLLSLFFPNKLIEQFINKIVATKVEVSHQCLYFFVPFCSV